MVLGDKSFLSPFLTLKNIFKPHQTVTYPQKDVNVFSKPGISPNYRGFHANDLDTCIGCGTCADICPFDAIQMKELAESENGKTTLRPVLDYGRCSYCAFCVDCCPSGSLTMTREYIHAVPFPKTLSIPDEVMDLKNQFTWQPTNKWLNNRGFQSSVESSWLNFRRTPMEEIDLSDRQSSFMEIIKGYSKEQAKLEADRCIGCGICKQNCPATMDIPNYIKAIREDDLSTALKLLYDTNPMPASCGRICTHNCENICAISLRGRSVAIRWLKRYIVDAFPALQNQDEFTRMPDTGKKIAILGGGPAGLSAAYYLKTMGHQITIYEKDPKLGGVLRYGIPAYRLPDEALDQDSAFIEALGVTVRTNTAIRDYQAFEQLRSNFDAILIATGLTEGRSTRIKGSEHHQVYRALELLHKIRNGLEIHLEPRISVIGGGNVAMDIARSLARLQRQKLGQVNVNVTCLECEEDMLCDIEERKEAIEEGITLYTEWAPQEIEIEGDQIKALKLQKCISIFDEQMCFNPLLDPETGLRIESTMIVEAIGQSPNFNFLSDDLKASLKFDRGRIPVNDNKQSALADIFVAGDLTKGPDAISAIEEGHLAAKGIDAFLNS